MRIILSLLVTIILTSCASAPLKAPCDHHAHWCGTKTKINPW